LTATFFAMFGLLALGLTNMESWYCLWAVLLGCAVSRLDVRLAVLFMSYGAALLASFYGFLWVWYGLGPDGLAVADRMAYGLVFVPGGLALLVWSFPTRWAGESESQSVTGVDP
jgi:hypothetical protein